MSPLENGHVFFDADASDLAFRAGQVVEKLLLDRGLESTRSSQSLIVTSDTIEACIDESLLEDLRTHLNDRAEQDTRKVA